MADKLIGGNHPCFIIAEAGVNHNGNINIAKKLIDIACEAKVDAVKFQTWVTEEFVTKKSKQAIYQYKNTKIKESQFDMLKKLELSFEEFREIKKYCDKKKIMFISTPDEEKSADFLCELNVPVLKIGSGELTNIPLLEHFSKKGLPIILSTGMGTIEEVGDAVKAIKKYNKNLVLLHCTSNYPTKLKNVNLRAMLTIKEKFGTIIGYSDHTKSLIVPCLAVAMGAKVIEKHFTYDKNAPGPDHKVSLNPEELKKMVDDIRQVEVILGSKNKILTKEEKKTKKVVRKTIVAKRDILKGTKLNKNLITLKRSEGALGVKDISGVLGKTTTKDIKKNDAISKGILK